MTKADWLRSEIEKLEGMTKAILFEGRDRHGNLNGYTSPTGRQEALAYNQALTSIITRYKEELLELEKGV